MFPALESRADILKMFDEMTAARKQILERCGRLGAAQLNDPVYPGTWSVLQNLAHLAWAEDYLLGWIRKRPGVLSQDEFPSEVAPGLGTVTKALDEAHAGAIAFVKANPESVLKERCQYSRHGEQTVGGVLWHVIQHEIHHRAFILHKLAELQGTQG
jgi:uncharacterized damage-inducible protein DinB